MCLVPLYPNYQPCGVAVVGWETDMLAIVVAVVAGAAVVDGVALTEASDVVVTIKF
jgi:hypothetical protein